MSTVDEDLRNLLDQLATNSKLTRHLADRTLILADSVNKNTEELLRTRQRLTEIYEQREYIRGGLDLVNQKLAVISKDVDDVEKVAREVSGIHKTKSTTKEHAVVGGLRAFGALPASTQVLVLVALVILGLSGWISKLF